MELDQVYKFCPRCKSEFSKKHNNLFECPNCGFHLYINPKPTNALILENDEGQFLLVQRKYEPKKGMWDTPGGFVDLKETVVESLRREIKEELGLEIKEPKYFGNYWSYYPYQGINYQTLLFVYTAKYKGEKIQTLDDVAAVKFFDLKNFPYEIIAFADVKAAIEEYIQKNS
jgi:NADH pyrophosphatase NudC (nudix superfamily)